MKIALRHAWVAVILATAASRVTFAQVNDPLGGFVSVTASSSMSLACTALTVQGTFNVGPGLVFNTGDVGIGVGGIINGGQGLLSMSGNWSNTGTFNAGTGTVVFTDGCAAGPLTLTGTTVFNNLTLTSANGRTFVMPAGSNITVLGTLTLQGANGQAIHLISSSGQTAIINLGPNSNVVSSYFDTNDVQIGATPQSIPTLSEYGLMLLALLMAMTALWQGQRRFFQAPSNDIQSRTE